MLGLSTLQFAHVLSHSVDYAFTFFSLSRYFIYTYILHPQKKNPRMFPSAYFYLASLLSMILAEVARMMKKVDVMGADHRGIFLGLWMGTHHLHLFKLLWGLWWFSQTCDHQWVTLHQRVYASSSQWKTRRWFLECGWRRTWHGSSQICWLSEEHQSGHSCSPSWAWKDGRKNYFFDSVFWSTKI